MVQQKVKKNVVFVAIAQPSDIAGTLHAQKIETILKNLKEITKVRLFDNLS